MKNTENKVELTDQQLNAVTGGLSARLAGFSCDVFEESDEYLAVLGIGFTRIRTDDKDCTCCKWWNSEEAVCTLGYHSEPRFFDPEWLGADPK